MNNCKICSTQMTNLKGYDSRYYGDMHKDFMHAYCPHCKKWYRWIEIFRFDYVVSFEEDNQSSFLISF